MASETFLSKANTAFALALYKKFNREDNTGNIFYSPFSISAALAMVRLGAAGNTATQMSEVLCFLKAETSQPGGHCAQDSQQSQQLPSMKSQDAKEDVDASFKQLLTELNKPDAFYALSIANRLYGEYTLQCHQRFLDETKKHYDAQMEKVDFIKSAEPSRIKINDWVEEKTQGKIANLLPSGSVNSMTKMVLVNAIYFKGKWDSPFKEESTVNAEFRLNKNDKKPVKMMYQSSKFKFRSVEDMKCKVLELPYEGNDLSMILILPDNIEDETTGLEKLEKELTSEKFQDWTRRDMMWSVEVKVSLPRFKLEQSYDMRKVLESMGMVDAFDVSKSDFSGMSEAKDLAISGVFHKAFVEVNEEGTEAAAATGFVFSCHSYTPPKTFNADHPFLFFIKHNLTNSVLFAGRYSSPE